MITLVSIYAVDPGSTTGVARGVYVRKPSSVWDGLENAESWEVTGPPALQAWEIMSEYRDWRDGIDQPGIMHCLVMEDFVMRLGTGASSKRELLDPVRIAGGCEALSYNRDWLRWAHIQYQSASAAKGFATNDRLRRAGLWVKGSEHRRDAVRHLATCYGALVSPSKNKNRQ